MAQGNLVQNGGFELGLAFWNASPTITTPQLVGNAGIDEQEELVHSGMMAAKLGANDATNPSGIWQDVPINPFTRFELIFHVTGADDDPTDLTAQVLWLDDSKTEIGQGLSIYIGKEALGGIQEGEWQTHAHITSISPSNARFARLTFSANGSGNNPVYLDDVVFFARS